MAMRMIILPHKFSRRCLDNIDTPFGHLQLNFIPIFLFIFLRLIKIPCKDTFPNLIALLILTILMRHTLYGIIGQVNIPVLRLQVKYLTTGSYITLVIYVTVEDIVNVGKKHVRADIEFAAVVKQG